MTTTKITPPFGFVLSTRTKAETHERENVSRKLEHNLLLPEMCCLTAEWYQTGRPLSSSAGGSCRGIGELKGWTGCGWQKCEGLTLSQPSALASTRSGSPAGGSGVRGCRCHCPTLNCFSHSLQGAQPGWGWCRSRCWTQSDPGCLATFGLDPGILQNWRSQGFGV